jgi:hypothetical protein
MSRLFKQLSAVALIGLLGSVAVAEPTADETAVRETATAFMTSIADGKGDEALKNFAGEEAEKKLIVTFAKMPPKIDGLKKAIESKFGADAAKELGGNDFDLKKQAERIKDAPVTVTGDTAVIKTQGEDGPTLKKVDGKWKVSSITGNPDLSEVMDELLVAVSGIMDTATTDINAGKYASVEEAKKGMETQAQAAMAPIFPKMMAAAMKKAAASAPTSQPGGATSPQPLPPQKAD